MKRKLSFFSLGWKGAVDLLCHYLKTSPTLDRGTLRMRFVLGWKSPHPIHTHTHAYIHTSAVSWAAIWHILQHIWLPVPLASDTLPCSSAVKKIHPKVFKIERWKILSWWHTTLYSVAQSHSNFLMWYNYAILIKQNPESSLGRVMSKSELITVNAIKAIFKRTCGLAVCMCLRTWVRSASWTKCVFTLCLFPQYLVLSVLHKYIK